MTAPCCMGEGRCRRLARRFSAGAASILPGAALVLLPKCPMCLAAWLAVATGLAIPAAAAAWMRGLVAVFWIGALALVAARLVRRRAHR